MKQKTDSTTNVPELENVETVKSPNAPKESVEAFEKSLLTANEIKRKVILLFIFSFLLGLAYVVMAFFSTWGDWTDSYFHQGHPERLAHDMINNSHTAGIFAGMYIVIQQILVFKYLKSVPKYGRAIMMFAMFLVSVAIVGFYSRELLREVQDNVMHLPQLVKYS